MPMLCAIVLAAIAAAPAVSDFYPLTPGIQRTYEVRLNGQTARQTETVGSSILIGTKRVTPVVQKAGEMGASTVYYAIEGDTLYLVAVAADKLLPTPIPVLKVGDRATKWDFGMDSPVLPEGKLTIRAESVLKGKRKVLGVEREVVEVHTQVSTPKGAPVLFSSQQTIVYAKGVGIVEWDDETCVGKSVRKRKIVLVSAEGIEPKG